MFNYELETNQSAQGFWAKTGRFFLFTIIAIVIFFIEQIGMALATLPNNKDTLHQLGAHSTTNSAYTLAIIGIGMIGFSIVAAFFAFSVLNQKPLFERIQWRHFKFVLIGLLTVYMLSILGAVLGQLANLGQTENQAALDSLLGPPNITSISLLFIVVFLAPIIEELLFRGIWMNVTFVQHPVLNMFLSGLIFGLLHINFQITNWADLASLFIYASMGVVLAYVFQRTGKIQYDVMLHMIINTLAGITMMQQAGWF